MPPHVQVVDVKGISRKYAVVELHKRNIHLTGISRSRTDLTFRFNYRITRGQLSKPVKGRGKYRVVAQPPEQMVEVPYEDKPPRLALEELMARSLKSESQT